MRPSRAVLLLEFNELSPALLDRFIEAGELPNFANLRDESDVYITEAAERPPHLEPWIQWITVHSGLDYADHGIFHLGDGHRLKEKAIWDILSDRGFRVWICGSMNVRYDVPLNGCILPDPWTTSPGPHPDGLMPYVKFVQANVLEHTNERVPLGTTDALRFLRFMLSHGLSYSTASAIVRQLVAERRGRHRWRRPFILDKLQFDLFDSVYRALKPHFSTFFLNSTAHLQHMYWRNMDPQRFTVKPPPSEQTEFATAILVGYREMDGLLGRFRRRYGDHATLVFSTALSQQPCLLYEDQGGKSFYRPWNFPRLLAFAGIGSPHTVSPVMAEEFHIDFRSERDAADASQRLRALRVGDLTVLSVQQRGSGLFSGCRIFHQLPPGVVLSSASDGRSAPFFDIFYCVEGKKSGMHHPDGALWIRRPDRRGRVHAGKVPLTSIAPTVLKMFAVPPPSFMRGEALPLDVPARSRVDVDAGSRVDTCQPGA